MALEHCRESIITNKICLLKQKVKGMENINNTCLIL